MVVWWIVVIIAFATGGLGCGIGWSVALLYAGKVNRKR